MVAGFFTKSALIQLVPLETGATVNISWYANTCLPQVFSTVSERRETRGLRGIIFYDDNAKSQNEVWMSNEFLLENNMKMQHILQIEVLASSCCFRN